VKTVITSFSLNSTKIWVNIKFLVGQWVKLVLLRDKSINFILNNFVWFLESNKLTCKLGNIVLLRNEEIIYFDKGTFQVNFHLSSNFNFCRGAKFSCLFILVHELYLNIFWHINHLYVNTCLHCWDFVN